MNTEYEIRVLEINHDELIKKLEELKAEFNLVLCNNVMFTI